MYLDNSITNHRWLSTACFVNSGWYFCYNYNWSYFILLLQGDSFLTLMSKVATFPPSGLHFPPLDEFPPLWPAFRIFRCFFARSCLKLVPPPLWNATGAARDTVAAFELRVDSHVLVSIFLWVSILLCLSAFSLTFRSSFAC